MLGLKANVALLSFNHTEAWNANKAST